MATASSTSPTDSRPVQELYDARAEKYDDSHHPGFVKKFLAFLDNEPVKPGDTVLDLACGTGLVTFHLAQHVAPDGRVYGFDISDGMLDVARRKHATSSHAVQQIVRLHNHSIDGLKSSDVTEGLEGAVDLITCASALVLLPDPAAAVAEWATYLRPGTGRLLVDALPATTMPSGLALDAACAHLAIPFPFSRLWMRDEKSLRSLIERHGSLIVERCDFVDQEATGSRRYDAGETEATRQLDLLVNGHIKGWFGRLPEAQQAVIRLNFGVQWAALVGDDGFVQDSDGVFVALARRKQLHE